MITNMQQKGFLLAVKAGEIMMKNGGEIYRVEEIITRICGACNIRHVEVFATPTGIFASIGSEGDNSEVKTFIKAIKYRCTDLDKISHINALSRNFVRGKISLDDALIEADKIENLKPFKLPMQLFGAALASSLFCLLFGGTLKDAVVGIFVGIISYLCSIFLGKYKISYFIVDFFCCGVATFLALLSTYLHLADNADFIIIGTLMLFVPGAAITNALRDFLTGDMLSGVARLTEAFAIAIALALGAGLVLKLWLYIGGIF